MKRVLIFAFSLLFVANVFAQTKNDKAISFPSSFVGRWKGELSWIPAGKPVQKVNMELIILPSKDSAGQYTWNLIYGSPDKDNRPYILKAVDTAKGHWVIDEVNGIILDQYWIANRFMGSFSVGASTIVNSYWLEGDQLMVEFISYGTKALATTGKGTDDSPKVDSHQIRSYQKGILKKQ